MPTTKRNAFTLIDVMITVSIIGILAAVSIPLVSQHLERAKEASAQSSYKMVEKAIGLYYQQNKAFPATLDDVTFVADEKITMPLGFQLQYDPTTGDVNLVELAPEDADGALAYINVE